jgi:arabinose-5-phosphate isomerase
MSKSSSSATRIDCAKEVIRAEQAGLTALIDTIDDNFSKSVDLILKTKGYLIVVGVGKSGHIGQKIAYSFASTGTPSFFMHPAEASHGDLGMVSSEATLLIFSSSGESRELRDVINYAGKTGVNIIGVTKNPNSTLGKSATLVLRLPSTPEACPNGLAPTTSTTNSLALADALMVTVMTERGFTREDFGQRHPGGKLGLQLQTVDQWLSLRPRPTPKILYSRPMRDVIVAITENRMGCVAVVDETDRLIGLITDGDLRRALTADIFSKAPTDIMSANPISLTRDMTIRGVVDLFADKRISNAFVVEDGKSIGLVDMKTLLEEGYI